MSYSATRLTCFALIAAVEDDMRAAIEEVFGDQEIDVAIPADRAVRAKARRARDGLPPATTLTGILPYLDFADSYELLMSGSSDIPLALRESLRAISKKVPRLVAIRNRVAHTRPMEIDDSAHLLDIAFELVQGSRGHWQSVDETLDRFRRDPAHVLGLAISLPADPDVGPQHNLPVPDFDETGLFGRRAELTRVKKAIKGAYPVVSILGDGGIGKTSVALKAAYELLDEGASPFDAVVWVTAKATILTTNEIRRISGAVESSLGLFAEAARELGGTLASDEPEAELLAYLETFKVLLILDNLETVLDTRLRSFLLDLPVGSKVLVTSRIGLGIENPVQLEPLPQDDSLRLMRALARIRNVPLLKDLKDEDAVRLVERMAGHPAYIRWFVAGVQAGRRPEELISDNALLLDFCMANVYEYLGDDARAVIRSMQTLPGARNQAELAFINDFAARRIQASLLELLTTNFVQMSSQSLGQSLDTVYALSDFGRQYLDSHHPVAAEERTWLLERNDLLAEYGVDLSAANSSSPYSPETVSVRGVGDVHVASLLREAIREAGSDPALALRNCVEAQVLAPSYFESWRVEATVRWTMHDRPAALAAYARAIEIAPDSAPLRFHYGNFLLEDAGDPKTGLHQLQASARLDEQSPEIAASIARAHFALGDMRSTVESCMHLLRLRQATQAQRRQALVTALKAGAKGVRTALFNQSTDAASELMEIVLEAVEIVDVEHVSGEIYDRVVEMGALAMELSTSAGGYMASKAREFRARFTERQRCAKPEDVGRRLGTLKVFKSAQGFGFVSTGGSDYFFHYRDLIDSGDRDRLFERVSCVFEPMANSPRGPRAARVRVLD